MKESESAPAGGDEFSFEEQFGYIFKDRSLLSQAVTHKSYHNENPDMSSGDNERLEFLGDSVLDLVLSELLMQKHPLADEGLLSKKRSLLVNESGLAEISKSFGLDQEMRLGRGESRNGGRKKPRLQSSVFEAVVGALYLDADFNTCRSVVHKIFAAKMGDELDAEELSDFKSRLQSLAQEKYKIVPVYHLDHSGGPDHDKVFEVSVWIDKTRMASGVGRSKKIAEQEAAEKAIKEWELRGE